MPVHFTKPALLITIACAVLISVRLSAQPANIQQLKDSIQKLVNEKHVPGLMVSIVSRDSILFTGGFGYADVAAQRAVSSTTLFRMGSVTKMFVSLAVLQLIQEGKLHLQDELKKIAPEIPFVNQWEAGNPIRIIHLLEHTTGFDDMKLNRMYSADKRNMSTEDMVLYQQHSLTSRWRPGERFSYCNPGYVILGYLVEKLSGKPYNSYLTENILLPIGMSHSNFNTASTIPAQETKEYIVRNGKPIEVSSVNLLTAPAGALWSCADDMARFVKLFVQNGAPLYTSGLIDSMETPESSLAVHAGLTTGYAKANMRQYLFAKNRWRGHGGLTGTCFSMLSYNRQLGAGFVIASNGNRRNDDIERLIVSYLEQQAVAVKPVPEAITKAALDSFAGCYRFISPRYQLTAFVDRFTNKVRLTVQGNQLFIQPLFGTKEALVHTGGLKFAYTNSNTPTIVLTKNEDGRSILADNDNYYEKSNSILPMGDLWLGAFIILLLLPAALSGIISFIMYITKRLPGKKLLIRLLPLVAVLLLYRAVVQMTELQKASYLLYELATVNTRTLIIFTGTLCFALFSLLHLVLVIRNFRKFSKRFYAVYWLLVSLSLCYLTVFLLQEGWIGLRTWSM